MKKNMRKYFFCGLGKDQHLETTIYTILPITQSRGSLNFQILQRKNGILKGTSFTHIVMNGCNIGALCISRSRELFTVNFPELVTIQHGLSYLSVSLISQILSNMIHYLIREQMKQLLFLPLAILH